jgi:methylthioribose-1-phosphate isomerase
VSIEERDRTEVTHIAGQRVAPEGVDVWNPAFDITPSKYISAIITEKGVVTKPYKRNLGKLRTKSR